MFCLVRKTVIHERHRSSISSFRKLLLCILQNNNTSVLSLRCISSTSEHNPFVASYLVNKFGISKERALSVSKLVKFESSERPDAVVSFLVKQGFSKTQINSLIWRYPSVLLSDTEKTILPKIKFLQSRGMSKALVARTLAASPNVLKRSLDNHIIPSFNLLRELLGSDEKTIHAIARRTTILAIDLKECVLPNIVLLRENGVPEQHIRTILHWQPTVFMLCNEQFKENLKIVKKWRFDPSKIQFVLALHALRSMSRATLETKFDAYRKWGWSEEDIFHAFRVNPWCLMASTDKIVAIMDFLVNKMAYKSSDIAQRSSILSLSMKNRIVPRGLLAQVLLSKGLIKDFPLAAFQIPEEPFLRRFVHCHKEIAPELLILHTQNLDSPSLSAQVL